MSQRRVIDFGFDPDASPHHFVVATHASGGVTIGERLGWGDDGTEAEPVRAKAVLDAYHWERIAERVAEEFNRRLRKAGDRAARWKRGETVLAPHFGKELTLLAWAVEGADPTVIPAMLANWSGLAPEERWWLYTTVNATFVRPEDEPRGWRRAIKIAFAENPVEVAPSALLAAPLPVSDEDRRAEAPRRGKGAKKAKPQSQIAMDLPGVQDDAAAYDSTEADETEDEEAE